MTKPLSYRMTGWPTRSTQSRLRALRPALRLRVAIVALSVLAATTALAQPEIVQPYNILLIVVDDLGPEQLQFLGVGTGDGFPEVGTIEQLAAEGVQFDFAWSNPICSPTRATIQTGKYGFRTGIGRATDVDDPRPNDFFDLCGLVNGPYLPDMLDTVAVDDYVTAAFGKWHMATNVEFSEQDNDNDTIVEGAPHEFGGYDYYRVTANNLTFVCPADWNLAGFQDYWNFCALEWDGSGPAQRVEYESAAVYATEWTSDEASAWIDAQHQLIDSPPWLAYVAFHSPHRPFHHPDDPAVDCSESKPACYRSMIENLDDEIDSLLFNPDGTLKDALSNTVIIFVSDNGTDKDVVRDPIVPMRAKGTLFEGGIRVPMIIKMPSGVPGIREGVVESDPVNLSDLFATIAELSGFSGTTEDLETQLGVSELDSISLVPYLIGTPPSEPLRDYVFTEFFEKNYLTPDLAACTPANDPFERIDVAIANENYKLLVRQHELPGLGGDCLPFESGPDSCYRESFYDLNEMDIWNPTNLCNQATNPNCALTPQTVIDAYCELRNTLEGMVDSEYPFPLPTNCCFIPPGTCPPIS